MLAAGVGVLFVLLAWPTNRDATGNARSTSAPTPASSSGCMLLSIAGVLLVAGANDIILLFLGIELASIPTYIMVSISRPLPVAQEAGVKYFFLGAMAAADHAVRVQLPVRHDGHDQPRRDRRARFAVDDRRAAARRVRSTPWQTARAS